MVSKSGNAGKPSSRKSKIYFISSVIFYILFIISFVFLMKKYAGEYVLRDIDRKLLMVAKTLPQILPADFHDRALNSKSISPAEWTDIENKLTILAESSGVIYVWSDIQIDGKVFLTTCNRTEQSSADGLQIYYFMPYTDGVSAEEMKAFDGEEPVFADFTDKWGHFRAVFIPYTSPGGRRYLSCAEYTIDYVEELMSRSQMLSMLVALSFFIAFLPVFFAYMYNYKTESKELEVHAAALEKSEENLRITLHSIGDGVIVTDTKGIITIINPIAESLTGWSDHSAEGKKVSDVLIIKNPETGEQVLYSADSFEEYQHKTKLLRNKVLVAADDTEKIISESVSLVKNKNNEPVGAVIVFRDITEYQKLEDELRQSQKLESIGQLAGGIAHDFNNMLGAIMGSAELLLIHLKKDDLLKNYGETILSASEKAAELTHKLLAFSRKGKIKNEPVDVHKSIDNVITLLQRSIDRRIEIVFSKKAEQSVVMGDNTLIENAILNIGINSRDAMHEGGIIRIITDNIFLDAKFCEISPFKLNPGNYIEIKILDNGSGIPKDIQKKIFEPFFTTKEQGKGTGLGLSAVYGTVKEHSGMIKLESEVGEGTAFTILLPVVEDECETGISDERYTYKGEGMVLIVDDEKLIRESAANLLENMCYNVLTAENGKEGIEIFTKNRESISLVILDMIMPKMGGKETFLKLREINPSLTVILSSGYARDKAVQELLDSGAAGFIQKPYRSSELAYILMEIDKKNRNSKKF
jgi:PAS domain S-box-containing protein